TQVLVSQELRRRGIRVTNQEISEAAQFSPPDYLVPQFASPSGGLDLAAYQSFLATLPPEQLLLLESYYRDVIPRSKLLRQVGSGIYLSDSELWQQWKDQNELAEVQYVPIDPETRYPDADFQISDSDIQAYYRSNQDEFEVPARATVRFAVIDKTATAADTAASRERAVAVRQEVVDGADFAEVAARESADPATAPLGGALGVFTPGRMIQPVDSVVFAAPVGELTQPVQTAQGFHIIEVMERWAADSVQARHILIRVERTDDSEIALLTLADSLEALGEAMGLAEAGAAAGLTVQTATITQDFPFLGGAGQVSEGAEWAFDEASPGDVSPVFETSTAFYALELLSSEPAGVLPLETARGAIEATLLFEQKMERGRTDAQRVADLASGGQALGNVAASEGLELRTAGPFARADFVPGIGRQNAVIGAAFGLPIGRVSDVLTTATNHYILEVMAQLPADSLAWRAQLPAQRTAAVAAVQQQRLQEWIEALRASARVVDRRDEVLQPADEDAPIQIPMGF
ncbi:MAG: peptidyl-prolyl cis-trans isomerase, partial [Gemmatimonadota bacterium]|nr:peptidyl-prolyl cis-trans isomerase [Gemmatimonadota bacterium]